MSEGELRGEGMNLECIATSEDGKEVEVPKKPELGENSYNDVVKYGDRVFEVPPEMIHYFSQQPEVLEDRIERAVENGMGHMYSDGGYGCHYCNHFTANIARMFSGEGAENPQQKYDQMDKVCTYEGEMGVRWAGRFTHKDTGMVVMAEKDPCVVNDSIIVEIVERGLLDDYESDRGFDFPTLNELDNDPELREQYRVREAEVGTPSSSEESFEDKSRGLFRRLYDGLIDLF